MNRKEAMDIYTHPKGRSKEELRVCLYTLNEAAQPVELDDLQFAAIVDATKRLMLIEGME